MTTSARLESHPRFMGFRDCPACGETLFAAEHAEFICADHMILCWRCDACDHALRQVAEKASVKAGLLINATRVALVGQPVAPPLFDTMVVLGKQRVVSRLRRALPLISARTVAG